MKKIIYLLISISLFIFAIYEFANIEKVTVKVECVDVAYASDKFGHIYRHHYFKYPNGRIKEKSGGYYDKGKSYMIIETSSDDNFLFGFVSLVISLGFFYRTYDVFREYREE